MSGPNGRQVESGVLARRQAWRVGKPWPPATRGLPDHLKAIHEPQMIEARPEPKTEPIRQPEPQRPPTTLLP
jgi:hypothetical protein